MLVIGNYARKAPACDKMNNSYLSCQRLVSSPQNWVQKVLALAKSKCMMASLCAQCPEHTFGCKWQIMAKLGLNWHGFDWQACDLL